MGLRKRIPDNALLIGGLFHWCIGDWYSSNRARMTRIARRRIDPAWTEAREQSALYNPDDFEKLSAEIQALYGMLFGYAHTYADDRRIWTINRKLVEVEFRVDMGDFDYAGKIDLVTLLKPQAKCYTVVEHKTARKISEAYITRLPMDTQVRSYVFGATQGLGLRVNEVLYDVVRKCSLRRKSGETADAFNARIAEDYEARPDFYFFRQPLKFNKSDIDAFEYEVRQTHAEFMAIINGSDPLDPRSWGPDDAECSAFFRTCPYLEVCTTGLDRGTGMLFEQHSDWHEELSGDYEEVMEA